MGNKITDSVSSLLDPQAPGSSEVHSRFVLSAENLQRMEQDVLEFSGVPRDSIWRVGVEVGRLAGFGSSITTSIRTVIISDKNPKRLLWKKYFLGRGSGSEPVSEPDTKWKQKLVLLHGYGQASALFYPVLLDLSKYFDIFLVDVVGMGCSARPTDFDSWAKTPEQVNDYFTQYLEKWRVKITPFL